MLIVSVARGSALDVESGLGTPGLTSLTEKVKMRVHHQSGEVLRHEIRGVLGPQDLSHLQLVEILLLLDPQGTDVNVPEFAGASAISDREGGRRIGIHHPTTFDTPILHGTAHS